MKRTSIIICALLACFTSVIAQPADSVYWVVETNLNNRSYSIVRFYNYRNEKVQEVRMQGVYLDITNPKHKKKLELLIQEYYERSAASARRKKPGIIPNRLSGGSEL